MTTGQDHRTLLRQHLLPGLLLTLALLGSGCKQTAKPGAAQPPTAVGTAGQTTAGSDKLPEFLPVPRKERKYQTVDNRVQQAWYLVETSYVVVKDKYDSATELMKSTDAATRSKGAAQKEAVTQEIQQNLFGTNLKVEQLFEDSIASTPDNPLNLESYAVYLLPRKAYKADGKNYDEQYDRALQMMDQAINLWPDEASFYLTKIAMMTSPLKVHEWTRSLSLEESTIQARMATIRDLFAKAEKYDPDNHMINYWHAQMIARLTPTKDFNTVKDEIIDQIRKGNAKAKGHFTFPAPADAWPEEGHFVKLDASDQDALNYDCWMNYGYYDIDGQLAIMGGLTPQLHYPQDKQTIGDLMFMLYNMGRTKPFQTSFFSWQEKVITTLMDDPGISQADKAKLASANFMLHDFYTSTCQTLLNNAMMGDPTKFDVGGLSEFEMQTTRLPRQREIIQPPHASYLFQVQTTLGLPPFPLDKDLTQWGS